MKVSKLAAVLVLGVLMGGAGVCRAQQSYQQKVEQWNAYQDILRAQDPNERLKFIDVFFKNYPQSEYRVFVYPTYAETAFAAGKGPRVLEAVDAFADLGDEQILAAYRQSNPNLEPSALDPVHYRMYVLNTFAFLQSFRDGTPNANEVAAKGAQRARKGLELHARLYANVQPPQGVTPEQFAAIKKQEEAAFHKVLAFVAWRGKDYNAAARENTILVEHAPEDPWVNYQLGLSLLQKQPPEYPHGFWHLARAINLKVPKSEEVRNYLTNAIAAYQQAVPTCVADQVDDLLEDSSKSVHPPEGWAIPKAEQVDALRQGLTVKRIFDDLEAGGDSAHLMWLASCGMEFPEIGGEVLEVAENEGNTVTLRVAATQEAADAKTPNVEVQVTEPPEAKNLKVGDFVRFTGILSHYQRDPQFLLELTSGKVNPEDIRKAAPARRGRGGGPR